MADNTFINAPLVLIPEDNPGNHSVLSGVTEKQRVIEHCFVVKHSTHEAVIRQSLPSFALSVVRNALRSLTFTFLNGYFFWKIT